MGSSICTLAMRGSPGPCSSKVAVMVEPEDRSKTFTVRSSEYLFSTRTEGVLLTRTS
jgi:hypothetical protein